MTQIKRIMKFRVSGVVFREAVVDIKLQILFPIPTFTYTSGIYNQDGSLPWADICIHSVAAGRPQAAACGLPALDFSQVRNDGRPCLGVPSLQARKDPTLANIKDLDGCWRLGWQD